MRAYDDRLCRQTAGKANPKNELVLNLSSPRPCVLLVYGPSPFCCFSHRYLLERRRTIRAGHALDNASHFPFMTAIQEISALAGTRHRTGESGRQSRFYCWRSLSELLPEVCKNSLHGLHYHQYGNYATMLQSRIFAAGFKPR